MGKMMEPQLLPPPIQSCKSPENGDYKIEGETLLETDQELHETIRSHPNDDDSSTAPEEAMDNESESSVDYPFYKNKEATETAFPLGSEVSAKPDAVLKSESTDMPDHASTPQKLAPTNGSDTYSAACQSESSSKTPFRTDHLNRPPRPPGQGSTKACAKKSFVWKYFRHPEISAGVADRSRTQCILCDSQLAFNASGTTTTMLNHLKSRHGDIAEQEESLRRHNRSKGPNRGGLSVSADHLPATDENCEHDGDTRVGGLLPNNRLTRSPVSVGQRGRPPGSGRRQKGSKQTDGMEHLNSVAMANCSLKPENNPLFAFGCYSGLMDPQQRALLNEMLMSAEALNGTKDNSLLAGITDQNGELGSFLAGGMAGAGGTPTRLDNNDSIGGLTNKSVSALLNRSSLLNAFSNASFPLTLPVSHELSPSSSSGLGVSVSSPLDTPTTTVSPVQPVNGRGITSPIGQTHWNGGANGTVHTTQISAVQNGGNRESIQAQSSAVSNRETVGTHPHVTGSVSVGRANGTINTSTSNSDIQNRLSTMNLFTPDASLGIPSTANSAGSAGMSAAVSNPSDLGPFDNFMNFMPSLNGTVAAGNYPLMDTLRFQQQLAANAWFASLANGKILNGSTNFGDTSALLSLFANSGSAANPDAGKLPPGSFTGNSASESGNGNVGLEGKTGFPFSFVPTVNQNEGINCHQQPPPPPPAPPTAAATATAQPPPGHSLGKSALDGLMIWSQLPATNGLGAAAAAAAANMQLPPFLNSDLLTTNLLHQHQQQQQQQQQQEQQQRLQHDRQQYMLQAPGGQQMFVPKTEVSLRNHMSAEAHMVHANFTGGHDGRIAEPRNITSLDLSKSASQAHSPESQTENIKARGTEERVTDSSMGNTASTKRKRARPVYISPESDTQKRRTMETDYPSSADSFESAGKTPVNLTSRNQVFSTDECQEESAGQPEIDDDDVDNSEGLKNKRKKPLSRARLLHELAHYLIRDMQPPETLEGEGFKNLLSTISDQLIPSAQEMRSTILANLSKQVRKKIDDKLHEFTKPNTDPTAETGTEMTTSPNISFALSVELWNMKERKILDPSHSSTDRNNYLSNIQLHCSPAENRKLQSFLYRSVQVGGSALFREVLRDCQRAINSPVLDSNNMNVPNQNGWWPCTLVTNHPHTVSTMLKESEQKATEADSPEYLVIPCLVSELARAVTTGLAVREIQSILQDCNRIVKLASKNDEKTPDERKDNSDDRKKSDFEETAHLTNTENTQLEEHNNAPVGDAVSDKGETTVDKFEEHAENHPTVSWTAAYELLKTACSTNAIKEMPEERRKCVKSLLSVIETMNQTLELIHRKDLVLTGSMIEPILENLIHTHLASNPEENKGELAVVELFKSRIADHLIQSYPTQGLVRETLQIASLLDPRFKEHVQEQKPETIKLLKTRTDCFPVQSTNGAKTNGAGNESSPSKTGEKPASDTTGLETVFGLQCFTRTSLSEVDRYLREDPIGLEEDPLAWWSEKTNAYPRVAALAAHYLTIPLTAFTPGRLRPLEATESGQKLHNSARPEDDELGLPNVVDVLGQGRQRIRTEDQAIYNYLWHNWDLTNVA